MVRVQCKHCLVSYMKKADHVSRWKGLCKECNYIQTSIEGGTKRCSKCREFKLFSEFRFSSGASGERAAYCKPCQSAHFKNWYRRTMEVRREKRKEYRNTKSGREAERAAERNRFLRAKQEFFDAYGGTCTCCGEGEFNFLTIEHKNGGGERHRQSLAPQRARGGCTMEVIRDLKRRGWPSDVTVLCMNCNMARTKGRVCPHQEPTPQIQYYGGW